MKVYVFEKCAESGGLMITAESIERAKALLSEEGHDAVTDSEWEGAVVIDAMNCVTESVISFRRLKK